MYTTRLGAGGDFDLSLLEERPGFVSVFVEGTGSKKIFENEAGVHSWQRIPPTEKRGRIQTSSITVAILDPEEESKFKLNERDVDIQTTRGSGPGGQARNKTDSCVIATHRPTGITVRIDMRSQFQGRNIAMKVLASRISEIESAKTLESRNSIRRNQVGHSDKRRTYREKDDRVIDNIMGKTWSYKQWLKGNW